MIFLQLNKKVVHFKSEKHDLSYLKKENYDVLFDKILKV